MSAGAVIVGATLAVALVYIEVIVGATLAVALVYIEEVVEQQS